MSTSPTDTSECEAVSIVPAPQGQGYRLETVQFLPRPRREVFAFFADAFQLELITPPWLQFSVLTPPPIEMVAGVMIDYHLRLHRVPIRWCSRIRVWQPPFRFVDEQLRGPYRVWHHEHTFEEVEGGTLCRDIVDYDAPGGRLLNILVRHDLKQIFQFRQSKLRELFRPC